MIERVDVPKELIGKGGVITKGMENSLLIFSIEEWKRLSDVIDSLPMTENRSIRKVARFFTVDAEQFDPEDTFVDLSDDLKEHINGKGETPEAGYIVTYGEGPFETMCWICYERCYTSNLEDLLDQAIVDGEPEDWNNLRDYLDNMRGDSDEDFQELKNAIEEIDIEELYRTLYYTFESKLSREEYERYKERYYSIFDSDVVDELFPEKSED